MVTQCWNCLGPSRSIWKQLQSYLSCSCCKELERRKPSLLITFSLWGLIELFISQIGSIGQLDSDESNWESTSSEQSWEVLSDWKNGSGFIRLKKTDESTLSFLWFYPFSSFSSRYFTENTVDPISVVSGLVQTGLYMDFFYSKFLSLSLFLLSLIPAFLSASLTDWNQSWSDLSSFILSLLKSLLHESHARRKVRTASLKEIIFQGMKKSEAWEIEMAAYRRSSGWFPNEGKERVGVLDLLDASGEW